MKKLHKVLYWGSTLWLALGMVISGILQLLQTDAEVEFVAALGYPSYLLILLGVWKLLGVVVLLAPKLPLWKEWAYAGFFFTMSGAAFSHIAVGKIAEAFPAMFLMVLVIVSWYFRSDSRKLAK